MDSVSRCHGREMLTHPLFTASKRVGLELEGRLYDLPPGYHAEYTKRVAAVTLDEVNQALQARLPEKDLLVVVVGTASEIRSAIEAKIPELGSTEIVAYDAEA